MVSQNDNKTKITQKTRLAVDRDKPELHGQLIQARQIQ